MLPYSDVCEVSLRTLRADGGYRTFVQRGAAGPRGGERLRIAPTPLHTEEHMRTLVEALVAVRSRLGWGAVSLAA